MAAARQPSNVRGHVGAKPPGAGNLLPATAASARADLRLGFAKSEEQLQWPLDLGNLSSWTPHSAETSARCACLQLQKSRHSISDKHEGGTGYVGATASTFRECSCHTVPLVHHPGGGCAPAGQAGRLSAHWRQMSASSTLSYGCAPFCNKLSCGSQAGCQKPSWWTTPTQRLAASGSKCVCSVSMTSSY